MRASLSTTCPGRVSMMVPVPQSCSLSPSTRSLTDEIISDGVCCAATKVDKTSGERNSSSVKAGFRFIRDFRVTSSERESSEKMKVRQGQKTDILGCVKISAARVSATSA